MNVKSDKPTQNKPYQRGLYVSMARVGGNLHLLTMMLENYDKLNQADGMTPEFLEHLGRCLARAQVAVLEAAAVSRGNDLIPE